MDGRGIRDVVTSDDADSSLQEDEPTLAGLEDPEIPEADALDQAREVIPGERHGPVSRGIDVPEADSIDQAIEVPVDEDEDEPPA
jgi:hypothetical protein